MFSAIDRVETAANLAQQVICSRGDTALQDTLFSFLLDNFNLSGVSRSDVQTLLDSPPEGSMIFEVDRLKTVSEPLVPVALAREMFAVHRVPANLSSPVFATFAQTYVSAIL